MSDEQKNHGAPLTVSAEKKNKFESFMDSTFCGNCGEKKFAHKGRALYCPEAAPLSGEGGEPTGAIIRKLRHKEKCFWLTPLPTGAGYWGCDCGLDKLLVDLEDYELAVAAQGQKDAPGDVQQKYEQHLSHVQAFLKEMWATIGDPLEDFGGNVEQLCAELLRLAREQREQLNKAVEVEARYREMCATLQECVQKHKLGLGGEHVDALVVAEIERLRVGGSPARSVEGRPDLMTEYLNNILSPEELYHLHGAAINEFINWLNDYFVVTACAALPGSLPSPAPPNAETLLKQYDAAVWLAGSKTATEGDGARLQEIRNQVLKLLSGPSLPSEETRATTRNSTVLAGFVAYCAANPGHRFWQALRNWSGYHFILAADMSKWEPVNARDTFNWEGRNDHE